MKNKIIGIFICMLMMTTGIVTIVGSDTKTTSQVVEEKDYGCVDKTYNMGIFPPPVMTEIPQFSVGEADTSSIALIDTPEYFNWMDYEGKDWTTPARQQGMCGSCWLFAAYGALESVINIREGLADLDPDLSEQYVLSCLPIAGSCNGGDPYLVFKYIRSNTSAGNYCNGTIPEVCFPYQGIDTVSCDEKAENWKEYLVPILSYGQIPNPQAQRELVKSTIMQKGPVVAYMMVNRSSMSFDKWIITHHNPDDYFPYEFENDISHVVIIVGWKDDSSIGKGGYWICKNSWGPNYGYNGFFNIEYESLAIEKYPMTWVDYDPGSYDWQPTPKAYGPYYGLINQPLQFKGNASGEHPPFTWLWDFDDGTTSAEQNPAHTYLSAGDYEVTLTVTDANNKSFYATTSAWIQETNEPPQISPIDAKKIAWKHAWWWYNFTVNDPDGGDVYLYYDIFNLIPDFWDGPYPSNEQISQWWILSESGSFTVKVKARDPYGAETDWATFKVIVVKSKAESLVDVSFFWEQLFQRFPNAFPILRQLLGN